jgi:DNA-binding SARP family transcriptional activator
MLELRLLGPPDLTVDGHPAPPELLWRKHLALLVYLALSPRRARTRDHLVGLLWGEKSETSARHSLREAVRVIRQGLGADAIETEGQLVRLALPGLRLDTEQFDACVARDDWTGAVRLVNGEFLEGFGVPGASGFEDWLTAERLEWRGRTSRALLEYARAGLREGRLEEGRRMAARALALDPLSNLTVQTAMEGECLAGDPAAALELFATFSRRARETGVEPGADTTALAQRVRTQPVPSRGAASARADAWTRRAPLVGRERVLSSLLDTWDATTSGRRAAVAMIEGDLGLGKTRVLEEFAGRAVLRGAIVAKALAVRADQADAGSGLIGLARGGLLAAPGIAAAPAGALSAFARRLGPWAERFPASRSVDAAPLGTAFRAIVLAALEEQALALVVDEAHWLDGDSLAALQALARDASDQPLLLVMSVMPSADAPMLDEFRAALGGAIDGRSIPLERLGAAELRTLAAWALPRYTPEALERVTRRVAIDSAGLPLLAIELLHAIALGLDPEASMGAWPSPFRTLESTLPGDLPDSVVAAVRVGFRALSPAAQQALAALSVLPERSPEALICQAVDLPVEQGRHALDELEWQRWVTADARGYAFTARVVRDIVARDMLTEGQRRRIAEAVGRQPG